MISASAAAALSPAASNISGCGEGVGAGSRPSVKGAPTMELEPRPAGVIAGPELECLLVEARRSGERVQGERSISGAAKRKTRTVRKRERWVQLERRDVVV